MKRRIRAMPFVIFRLEVKVRLGSFDFPNVKEREKPIVPKRITLPMEKEVRYRIGLVRCLVE